MKIISGIYKGRKLDGYDIEGTRPTMDRVKESLFATIQSKVVDSVVLDLFTGSGNLGIEALSNGASFAYLVDNNYKAIKVVQRNVTNLGIKNCQIIRNDYQKVLKEIDKKFDIIFLDPPYKTDYIEKALNLIEENKCLTKDGIVVCESSSLDKIIYSTNYKSIKEKKYGDKWVVILKQI